MSWWNNKEVKYLMKYNKRRRNLNADRQAKRFNFIPK